MDNSLVGGLGAVAVVVVLALLMRRGKSDDTVGSYPLNPEQSRDGRARDEDDDEERDGDANDDDADGEDAEEGHVIAVTSDGEALIPHLHAVRLLPPEDEGEEWKVGAGIRSVSRRGELALARSLQVGDFTGVRVTPGGDEGEGPWRLEAMGRDGEYITFSFETRDGAEAAKQLFERMNIVHLGEDEDGRPIPPSAEQFAEARRINLETAAELGLPDEEGPR